MNPGTLFFTITICITFLVGCGEQPTPSAASTEPKSAAPLLTADELEALFLKDAQVWKFSSDTGLAAKKVSLQIIDNGTQKTSSTTYLGEHEKITSIIVVAQQFEKQHMLKFYVKHIGGSSLSASSAWFSKPLLVWGQITHKEPAPLTLGTVTLLSGASEKPETGKVYSSENDPYRLELVIE